MLYLCSLFNLYEVRSVVFLNHIKSGKVYIKDYITSIRGGTCNITLNLRRRRIGMGRALVDRNLKQETR